MTTKRLLIGIGVLAVAAGLLALDLANRGLVWRFGWSVTGEERPLSQLRGVADWALNITRPQPRTQPMTPMQHTGENPYGINTFFHQEVEAQKIDDGMRMIAEAGFTWIREQFPWEDIEVDGRGVYLDSRNANLGTISSWIKYDRIVDLAEQHGLRIQARLDNPPDWAHADPAVGSFAPPDDLQDYLNFVTIIAERYRGRITHYQVWNEPNIYPEWGNQDVNPEAYTDLLCQTYAALKAVDPDIVVISGALAPTVSLTGRDLNDFIFLQRMYDAGAADCFDVLSIQGYGLNSGPTDRRLRPTVVNVARNLYIRDLMVANGDAHKPIWISEAAWNFVPTVEQEPTISGYRQMFGQVTPQQAADYMPLFYQRAQQEWPWVGVVNYWFFTRRDDSESDQPKYYFRMVEPHYQPDNDPPFEPLPVYESMRAHITGETPTLYRGTHRAYGHWAVTLAADAQPTTSAGADFDAVARTTGAAFHAHGTDVLLRWQGQSLTVRVDGNGAATTHTFTASGDDWRSARVPLGLLPRTAHISVESSAGEPFLLDSIAVLDRSFEHVYPLAGVAFTGALLLVIAVGVGLRGRKTNRGAAPNSATTTPAVQNRWLQIPDPLKGSYPLWQATKIIFCASLAGTQFVARCFNAGRGFAQSPGAATT